LDSIRWASRLDVSLCRGRILRALEEIDSVGRD
jgi:hypothetical protein